MNGTPTPSKKMNIKLEKAPKPAGTRLMYAGGIIAIIGAVLAIMAASTSHFDTYRGVLVHGDPTGGIIVIILGLILTGVGFGRRVLAALEGGRIK